MSNKLKKKILDSTEILKNMSRLKEGRRIPTSIALDENTINDLKKLASEYGVPYQVLMRTLLVNSISLLKENH
jgi:predicted DNA binding CopG/RHH family protein